MLIALMERGLKMIWEAKDETIKDIQIGNKKILEISNDWHIESV